jgi:murein L,D-transpeptidase YcbB/YkuD
MKNALLKLLFSKAGPYIAGAVGSGLAVASVKLASYGVVLTPDEQTQFAGWLAGAIIAAMQGMLLAKSSNAVKEIQQATGSPIDGVAGPVTIKAVKQAVTSPARKLPKIGGAGK